MPQGVPFVRPNGPARSGKVLWDIARAEYAPKATRYASTLYDVVIKYRALLGVNAADPTQPHHIRKMLAELHDWDVLGVGFMAWQVQITLMIVFLCIAMSAGAFMDADNGALLCVMGKGGRQSCAQMTYADTKLLNTSANDLQGFVAKLDKESKSSGGCKSAVEMLDLGATSGRRLLEPAISVESAECIAMVANLGCDFDFAGMLGERIARSVRDACPLSCKAQTTAAQRRSLTDTAGSYNKALTPSRLKTWGGTLMAFQIIAQLVMLLGTVVTIFKIVETSIFSQGFALLGLSATMIVLAVLHNTVSNWAQTMVDESIMEKLIADGLTDDVDFSPLVFGSYMWNCCLNEMFGAILLGSCSWKYLLHMCTSGTDEVTWLETLPSLHATRRKEFIILNGAIIYMLSSATFYRMMRPKTFNTFAQSFYFVMTTSTTIGYGELSPVVPADGDDPEVRAGPVLGFMLFAGLGIFITANTIQILGEMSSDVCNELLARYFKPVVDEVVEKVEEAMEEGEIEPPPGLGAVGMLWDTLRRWRTVLLGTGAWLIVLLMIGPWYMTDTHDWSYMEALYFIFSTMTSIGFGDYYPNDDRAFNRRPGAAPQLGSSSVSIWLISADFILVSLVVFAFLLHTAQEHLRENAERRRDENQ